MDAAKESEPLLGSLFDGPKFVCLVNETRMKLHERLAFETQFDWPSNEVPRSKHIAEIGDEGVQLTHSAAEYKSQWIHLWTRNTSGLKIF